MVVANILDPVHDTLDPTVWDAVNEHQPILKPQHKVWITDVIHRVLKDHGYGDMDKWLEVYLTGSLTTFQYSGDSDCDISLFVNTDVFPEWSRAEMIGIMVSNIDGTPLPGTSHPMQVYVVPKSIRPQDLYKPGLRSGYLIAADRWVVPPERERTHDVEAEQNADYQYALQQADKMERLLRYEPHKAVQFWHQIHARRQADQRAGKGDFSQSNIIYKFLNNRGLFPQIEEASGEHIAGLTMPNPLPTSLDDHWLTWHPGTEGKGFILENGRVWHWPTENLRPMHLNRTAPVKSMGGRVRPETAFHIQPDGGVFQVGPGRKLDDLDMARLFMADHRLKSTKPPKSTEGYGHSQEVYEKLRTGGAPEPWGLKHDAIEKARQHLGLGLPVQVNFVQGTHGQYHGLNEDGHHEIDLVTWLKPESASKQLWHEMAHARQQERDPATWTRHVTDYNDLRNLTGHSGYWNHPWEIEAREVAESHPFSLVHGFKTPDNLSPEPIWQSVSTTNKGPNAGQEANPTSEQTSNEAWSFH